MQNSPSPFGTDNAYASPLHGGLRASSAVNAPRFPVFARVMFIVSLVFCCLRMLMVPLSILGYASGAAAEMGTSVLFEIITGIGIAVFGVLGNGLLLARKPIGVTFGWLLVLSVLGSLAVGLWQAFMLWSDMEPGTPEFIGIVIGLVFTLAIRVSLLIAYIAALMMFGKWLRAQAGVPNY